MSTAACLAHPWEQGRSAVATFKSEQGPSASAWRAGYPQTLCLSACKQHGAQVAHKLCLERRAQQDAAVAQLGVVLNLRAATSQVGVYHLAAVSAVMEQRAVAVQGPVQYPKPTHPLANHKPPSPPPNAPIQPPGTHLCGVPRQLDVCPDELSRHQVIPPGQHHQAAGQGRARRWCRAASAQPSEPQRR